jgi:phosphoenolpyruvate---glycerone phosphotransferase subunit DhaM
VTESSVGIVLISHSTKLAEGAVEMVSQIAAGARVFAAGGADDGRLGTSTERVAAAIAEADTGGGVLLIPDMGSSVLSARAVLADLDPRPEGQQIQLVDAPFIEGAVAAAVAASVGLDLAAVATAAEDARDVRKL